MIIQSKRILLNGRLFPAQINILDGKIVGIYSYNHLKADKDYNNDIITPGFIDIHTHGGYGCDLNRPDNDSLKVWLSGLLQEGVTSVYPAVMTDKKETMLQALSIIGNHPLTGHGASILGIHLEGPFVNQDYRGGMLKEYLAPPSIEHFDELNQASNYLIKYVTLAPELDVGYSLINYLIDNKITVSLGHSSLDYAASVLALVNGATGLTHTFNAMTPMHHRAPGTVSAAMTLDTFAEIVADGQHVHPEIAKILFATNKKMIVVTDSMKFKGLKPGIYDAGEPRPGTKIEIDDHGTCYLYGENQILGSTLKFNRAIEILVEDAQVPLNEALMAVSTNPARLLKIDNKKGRINVNNDADLVIIDKDYQIVETFVLGERKYKRS